MTYKYSKGSQVIGDLKAQDDNERDTLIDFGEDRIDLQTSGSTRLKISGSQGQITFNEAYTFPYLDGARDQVLATDGAGGVSWVDPASGGGGGGVRTVSVDTDGDGIADQTLASGEDLVLKAGSNITLSESGGVVTINTINIKPLVRDVEFPNSNQDLATAGINADVYAVDCNGGSRTITLPAPGASHRGKQITFIKNAGVNTLTITAGTNNIYDQGVATTNYNITGHLRNVTLVCLDYGWIVIAEA